MSVTPDGRPVEIPVIDTPNHHGLIVDGGTPYAGGSLVRVRRGTAAQWTASNPVLRSGEEGLETDTGLRKTGDNSTAWASLAYNGAGTFLTQTSATATYVRVFTPELYGSIQAAITAAATAGGGEVLVSTTTTVTTQINLPATTAIRLRCAKNAYIRAGATMTAVLAKPAGACDGHELVDVNLDGNMQASYCLDFEQGTNLKIKDGTWKNAKTEVAAFGRQGGQGYQMIWSGTLLIGLSDGFAGANPANMPNYGYRLYSAWTDNHITDITIKNAKIYVRDEAGGGNVHTKIHGYGYPYGASGALDFSCTKSFECVGALARFVSCYSDTSPLGFDVQAPYVSITAPIFYWPADYAPAGTVVGFNIAAQNAVITGPEMPISLSSPITGAYAVQIQNGINPTHVSALAMYGSGWAGAYNLIGTGNTPVSIGNIWSHGTVPNTLGAATFRAGPAIITGTLGVGGEATVTDLKVTGLTGAVNQGRFVGVTGTGAPTTGTFAVGDYVVSQAGNMFVCVAAGTPGTWVSPRDTTDLLASGQECFARTSMGSSRTAISGQMVLSYWTARKSETVTQAVTLSGTAAGATPTLCRIGLYTSDGAASPNLTGPVASVANDTTLWATGATRYVSNLSAGYAVVAGQRYATGVLIVTGASLPSWSAAVVGSTGAEAQQQPRLTGFINSLSDLPSNPTDSSTGVPARVYSALLP